jgi:hypothetical protein
MAFTIDSLTAVKAHWSADQVAGSPADGDAVSSLPDSIAGWNLSGTTTTRPLYKTTAGPNGLPSLLFDGTDDFLVTASKSLAMTNPSCVIIGSPTLKNYNTLFYLSTYSGQPAYGDPRTRIWNLIYNNGNTNISTGNGVNVSTVSAVSLLSSGVKFMLTSHHGACFGARAKHNGGVFNYSAASAIAAGLESATTLYANFGRSSLGGSFFQGYLSEMVLWDETLLSESAYIEGVLAEKYAITLPVTHPFYSGAPLTGPSTGSSSSRMVNVRGGADQ